MEQIVFNYCRKSSEDSKKQVQSIEDQIQWGKEEAIRRYLPIHKTFTDEKTGTKAGVREGFNCMMQEVKKAKGKVIIITWKLNRLARNPVDGGYIQQLLIEDKIEVHSTDGVFNSNSNLILLGVHFGVSTQYSIDLSKDVKRGMNSKRNKGGWNHRAPLGYINNKEKRTLFVDKKRARYIEKAFEMRACGYTYAEIANHLFESGFRSVAGKKVNYNSIEKIISRKFYCGVIELADKEIKGLHKPIVNLELWEKANGINKKQNAVRPNTYFFAYKGFLKCGECGASITAECKKKKLLTTGEKRQYVYYRCKKNKGPCSQSSLREDDLELEIIKELDSIQISDKFYKLAVRALKDKTDLDEHERSVHVDTLNNEFDQLKKREKNLLDMRLDEKINQEMYEKQNKEISAKKLSIESKIGRINDDNSENYVYALKTVELLRNPISFWNKLNYEQKGHLFKIFWSNGEIKGKQWLHKGETELFKILKSVNISYGGACQSRTGDLLRAKQAL